MPNIAKVGIFSTKSWFTISIIETFKYWKDHILNMYPGKRFVQPDFVKE